MITHLGFFWTDKQDDEATQRVLAAARELLTSIPDMENFHAGTAMSSPRGSVDDSFSVAISMQFATEEALQAYLQHPRHVQFVNDYVKKDVRRLLIYDIES